MAGSGVSGAWGDEPRLIARARAGDREAQDQLFRRHLPLLRRWTSGRLPRWARDIADTTDLVQDTALEALRRLPHFEDRGDGALQAYLRQAVVNRIRNALRSRARRPLPVDLSPSLVDTEASPLEQAIGKEMLSHYDAALATLTAEDRATVVGRVELGLDHHELAALLGKPTANAARMSLSRALLRLATAMGERAKGPGRRD